MAVKNSLYLCESQVGMLFLLLLLVRSPKVEISAITKTLLKI